MQCWQPKDIDSGTAPPAVMDTVFEGGTAAAQIVEAEVHTVVGGDTAAGDTAAGDTVAGSTAAGVRHTAVAGGIAAAGPVEGIAVVWFAEGIAVAEPAEGNDGEAAAGATGEVAESAAGHTAEGFADHNSGALAVDIEKDTDYIRYQYCGQVGSCRTIALPCRLVQSLGEDPGRKKAVKSVQSRGRE